MPDDMYLSDLPGYDCVGDPTDDGVVFVQAPVLIEADDFLRESAADAVAYVQTDGVYLDAEQATQVAERLLDFAADTENESGPMDDGPSDAKGVGPELAFPWPKSPFAPSTPSIEEHLAVIAEAVTRLAELADFPPHIVNHFSAEPPPMSAALLDAYIKGTQGLGL